MIIERADIEHGEALWLFTGTTLTDDHIAFYLDSIERLMLKVPPGIRPAAIQVVERSSPVPNAAQRHLIAERTKNMVRNDAVFCMCTDNQLIRGVATAINWMRRPPYDFIASSTFEEAVAAVQSARGSPVHAFERMFKDAQAEKARRLG